MGYELYITQRENWSDAGSGFSLDAWRDHVAQDPDLRLDNAAEITTPAMDTLRYENQGLAAWTGHPGTHAADKPVWFDFRNGNVIVKNPDRETVIKMYEIAQALDGKVQGEEGECYGPDGEPLGARSPAPGSSGKPWWRPW